MTWRAREDALFLRARSPRKEVRRERGDEGDFEQQAAQRLGGHAIREGDDAPLSPRW
jgi:hypothetical protein